MLACTLLDWPREGHTEPDHPLQLRIRELHTDLAGLPLDEVRVGTDGYSVPAFALPLMGAARIFARLAANLRRG